MLLDGHPASASTRVSGGETLLLKPPPEPLDTPVLEPEQSELSVLYRDADLIVIDKPAGLSVHPGAGRPAGTLANRLLHHFSALAGVGHPRRPGIVHRLDKDTTGVMVVAANDLAYRRLSAAFAERRVAKVYLALVHGAVDEPLIVDAPIGRHRSDRKKMAVRSGSGRSALTSAYPLEQPATERLSALAVRLHTGRTHQIRVHLKYAGHPLIGDPTYGEARWKELTGAERRLVRGFSRPALHAWWIRFRHPTTGDWISFTAPVASDLVELWSDLGGVGLRQLRPPATATA